MSTAIARIDPQQAVAIENEWDDNRRDFIRRNFCAGAPDEFVQPFLALCEKRNLSPEAKHIYLVPRWDNKNKRNIYVPQTSIDGYRLIATRTGVYAGSDDPVYTEQHGKVIKATVTVYRAVAGMRCPFSASAYWDEYVPGEKQDFMWKKMPHVMLGKVAESLALRKAFPEELSGMYTTDEMAQATTSLREVPVDEDTGEILDGEYTEQEAPAAPAEEVMPFISKQEAEAYVERIVAANLIQGKDAEGNSLDGERLTSLSKLYKEAKDGKSLEKIELLVQHAAQYDEAVKMADTAKRAGLLSPHAEKIMADRTERNAIEQKQEAPA